ncbi:MAG: hypothetical protein RLZZ393_1448 [Pseudomonadota bacterium]|jgi:lipopolysaccharide export system permease protein
MRFPGGILFRHVLREVGLASLAVALVLMVLLVTNQLAFVLERVADGQLPGGLVLEMLRLSVTENAGVILPISLLLGVAVALGRLYHDSELAAAQACGMGPATVFAAVGTVTLVAVVLAAWVAFFAGPDGAKRRAEIRADALRTALVRGLAPGQFRSLGGGAVLYFRERGEDGVLRDVFFERRVAAGAEGEGRIEVVLAASARYNLAADGSLAAVVLQDGRHYEGQPGGGAWRVMQFREQTVPVRPSGITAPAPRADAQPLAVLRRSTDGRYQAEYHWRLASVVITLVLGVLAVPLSRLRPRQGRYARVVWVVLLYAIYANLLISGRTLIEKGSVPAWLGLWWVHVVMVLLGLGILGLPRALERLRRGRALTASGVSSPPGTA